MKKTNETIILNARGIKYEVLLDSLEMFPNSRLGRLRHHIIEKQLIHIGQTCDKFNADLTEFYFNRDPFILNMFLNSYQTGELHISQNYCSLFMREEMDYWQLDEAKLEPCCLVHLHKRLEENQEVLEIKESLITGPAPCENFGTTFYPQMRERIWNFFDKPKSSISAQCVFYLSVGMIILSTIILIIQTIPSLGLIDDSAHPLSETHTAVNLTSTQSVHNHSTEPKPSHLVLARTIIFILEMICITWFLVEFIIRFICCPNKMIFMKSPLNIIDFVSGLPYLVLLILSDHISGSSRNILRMLRILLLFKITRFSTSLKAFVNCLIYSSKEFVILFVYSCICVVFFSTIIFYCEKDEDGSSFTSIPATFWWGVITITSVGYGDMTPVTIGGKLIASVCAVTGVLILAMPIGVISTNFYRTIEIKKYEKYLIKAMSREAFCADRRNQLQIRF